MTLYATLDELKDELKSVDANTNSSLIRRLRTVSRRLDMEFLSKKELFAPVYETRKFAVTPARINSSYGLFKLDGPLQSLSAVSAGNTALVIGTNVNVYPDSTRPPFPYLRLTANAVYDWYGYGHCLDDGSPSFVTVTGYWAYHRDYANAWASVDALAADINASVTALTVADVDGVDLYGLIPRISIGNLLKIDSEFMEVIGTNTTTNVVTVRRGANGTTAAAHLQTAAVAVWQVEDAVKYAVARQTAMIFARKGAYTTVVIDAGGGEVRFPADLLTEVRAIMQDVMNYGY